MLWEIDPFHSLVEFSVQHLKVSTVKGRFTEVHGTTNLDTQHPEHSWVKVQIATNSIHTGASQRDAHLRSADFFEVVKYPSITYTSTQVKLIDQNRAYVNGDLTLHGVTRPVALQVMYTGNSQDLITEAWRVGLHGTTIIDRRDFGITFNKERAGTLLIGHEIRIYMTIEAILMQ
ncbi:MAG TPA: YceI family protein [Ktedonobacteraceae bacterium]|jgi:polyisoprenoid-binding protein YceI|nr:YceI family protein [Ktedonobacteraceae bacterium]